MATALGPRRCLAKYEIHFFIFSSLSFSGYITNQYNDHLPVGLPTQLVRALYRKEFPTKLARNKTTRTVNYTDQSDAVSIIHPVLIIFVFMMNFSSLGVLSRLGRAVKHRRIWQPFLIARRHMKFIAK